ncbi:MAG: hypothetical protein AAF226_14175 [Verrucomicrobiota bacterium]
MKYVRLPKHSELGCFGLIITVGAVFAISLLITYSKKLLLLGAEQHPAEMVSFESRQHKGKNGYSLIPEVVFEYQIGGKDYTTDTVSLLRNDSIFHRQLKTKWDSNRKTDLFVSNHIPTVAAYDVKFHPWPTSAMFIFALGWLGMGIHGLIHSLAKKQR